MSTTHDESNMSDNDQAPKTLEHLLKDTYAALGLPLEQTTGFTSIDAHAIVPLLPGQTARELRSFQRRLPDYSRLGIFSRDNYRCRFCGQDVSKDGMKNMPTQQAVLCHMTVPAHGGKTSWDNCVTACYRCVQKKGDRTPEEAGMALIPLEHPMFDKADELSSDGMTDSIGKHYGPDSDPHVYFIPAFNEEELPPPQAINPSAFLDRIKTFHVPKMKNFTKDDGDFARSVVSFAHAIKTNIDPVTPLLEEGDVFTCSALGITLRRTVMLVLRGSRNDYKLRIENGTQEGEVACIAIAEMDAIIKKTGCTIERDGKFIVMPPEGGNQVTIE